MAETVGEMTAKLVIDVANEEAKADLQSFAHSAKQNLGMVEAHLTAASAYAQEFGAKWQNTMAACRTAGIALGAVGSAIVTTLGVLAKQAGDMGGKFYEGSQKVGLTVEQLSALGYAAGQSGMSLETIQTIMSRQARSAMAASQGTGGAADAYKKLGVQVTDANGRLKSNHDLMLETADALKRMDNATQRNALAIAIFGRGAKEMMPLLMEGAEGIRAMEKRAAELGLVLSSSTAKELDEYGDRWQAAREGLVMSAQLIGSTVLPIFAQLTEHLASGALAIRQFAQEHPGIAKVALAFGALGMAAGPLLVVLPKMVQLWQALPSTLLAVGSAAKAAWAAMTGPVGIVVALAAVALAWLGVRTAINAAREAAEKEAARAWADEQAQKDLAADETGRIRKRIQDMEQELAVRQDMARKMYEENSKNWTLDKRARDEANRQYEENDKRIEELKKRIDAYRDALGAKIEMEERGVQSMDDEEEATKAQEKAFEGLTSAVKSQRDAWDAVTEAQDAVTQAVKDGERAIRDAQKAYDEAWAAIDKAVTDANKSVADALDKANEAHDRAAEAVTDAADANEKAAKRVADAQEKLADAQEAASDRRRDQADREIDTLQRLVEANQTAKEALMTAEDRANERILQAQDKLADAREKYRRMFLPELTKEEKEWLRQRDAMAAVTKAQYDLDKARTQGQDELAKARDKAARAAAAQKNIERDFPGAIGKATQMGRWTPEEKAYRDLMEQSRKESIRDARTERDAQQALTDAIRDQGKVRDDEAKKVAAAQKAEREAWDAYQTAILEGRKKIDEAVAKAGEAAEKLADTKEQAGKRVVDALKRQLDAEEKYADAVKKTEEATKALVEATNQRVAQGEETNAQQSWMAQAQAQGMTEQQAADLWAKNIKPNRERMRERYGESPEETVARWREGGMDAVRAQRDRAQGVQAPASGYGAGVGGGTGTAPLVGTVNLTVQGSVADREKFLADVSAAIGMALRGASYAQRAMFPSE